MPRYMTRARAGGWAEDETFPPEYDGGERTIEVHDGRRPVDTGLLDADGERLFRLPDRIGFRLERA